MKRTILNIAKIILSAVTFPLWFVKMYVGIGYLPSQDGEPLKVVFRHSMYENICDGESPFLVYLAMTTAISAIVLHVVNLKIRSKKAQTIGNIVFGVAIGLFLILMLYASTVARGY